MFVCVCVLRPQNFANKNGQIEALEHDKLINNEQGFEVVKHARTTIDALDYPDLMHHFTEESDYAKIIMEVTTLLFLWVTIIYQTWLGMMKLSRIIFKGIWDHKRTTYCKGMPSPPIKCD